MSNNQIQQLVEKFLGSTIKQAKEFCKHYSWKICRCKSNNTSGSKMMSFSCSCAYDPNVCWCINCFDMEKHKGHTYVHHSDSTFHCDCGNSKIMPESSFCQHHGKICTENSKELLPKRYENVPTFMDNTLKTFIKKLNNIKPQQPVDYDKIIHGKILCELKQVDLFFYVLSDLLTQEIDPSWNSILKTHFGYEKVTIHQYLYEKYFTLPFDPNSSLVEILTDFHSDISHIRFDHKTIYDLSLYAMLYTNQRMALIMKPTHVFRITDSYVND